MTARGWERPFDEPIEVDGRELVTLPEAGEYITPAQAEEGSVKEAA